MYRRGFIRSVAVGTLTVAGCSHSATESDDPRETRTGQQSGTSQVGGSDAALTDIANNWGLDEVVNLARAGADSDGEDPIDDVLTDHAIDGALVYLPPGVYRIEESFSLGEDARLGLIGDQATIQPPDGSSDTVFGFGWPEPMSEISVRGIEFDFTASDTGGRPVLARASDHVRLKDISVRGEIDTNEDQVRIDVTDPEGIGVIENLSLPDGAARDTNVTGCEVGSDNHGDLRFLDCHIEGFTDNGLYADPPEGSVTVDGGFFRNNGIAGVRIQTSESSVVRDVHVVCDDDDSDLDNMRGIRLRAGRDLLVEDCLVEMLKVSTSDGAVTFASELESATVRNCHLRVDADGVNAIRMKSPPSDASRRTKQGPFRCENVIVTGTAADGAAIEAANRSACEFEGVCVVQPGKGRDGLLTENVDGTLRDVHIAVSGEPLVLRSSIFQRHNVSTSRNPDGRFPCPDLHL